MSEFLSFLGVIASAAAVAGILLLVLEAPSRRRHQSSGSEAEVPRHIRAAL